MLTRRSVLVGVGATAAAIALPSPPITLPAQTVPVPRLPVWSVGTPGDFDWHLVRATTRDDAIGAWIDEAGWESDDCGDGCADQCKCRPGVDADRTPELDATEHLDAEAECRIGWGCICARCGYEYHEGDWRPIDGERVCDECTTLSEWERIDPERHAELMADMLDDEYGSITST